MKIIIFSDLHANLFGLSRIMDFARRENIEQIYCLGDIVGYHSYPSECIQVLQGHDVPAIKGNHEALLLGELKGFDKISVRAQHSLMHTRRLLNEKELAYLKQLPFSLAINKRIQLVHANYDNLTRTVNTVEKAQKVFEHAIRNNIYLTFLGHTHRPGGFMMDKTTGKIVPIHFREVIQLYEANYYIINPGSAGESRHGLPLSFVLFDDKKMTIRFELISLSSEEIKTLKRHNRQVFGPLTPKQKLAQGKEKLRRFYYALAKARPFV